LTTRRRRRATGLLDGSELVAGAFLAGTLSGLPSTVHALATGRRVRRTVEAAGELLGRPGVARGVVAHAAMTIGWTTVLLTVVPPRRSPVVLAAFGGLAIAGLDLTIADWWFPAIAALPRWPQVLDHVLFGILVGSIIARRAARTSRCR
jgi:hypothetical protein